MMSDHDNDQHKPLVKTPITFNESEREMSYPGISFDRWNIDTNEPYNYYKELDNLKREMNRPPIEFLEGGRMRICRDFISNFGSYVNSVEYKGWDKIYSEIVTHRPEGEIKKFLKQGYYKDFKNKSIQSPFDGSLYKIGCAGVGKYNYTDHKIFYNYFMRMFVRGFDKNVKSKQPSYIDVTVSLEWWNFQNFATWCDENYYQINGESMALDKDILIKRNKTYKPEACMFVTPRINSLFTKCNKVRGEFYIGVHRDTEQPHLFVAAATLNNVKTTIGRRSTPEEAFYLYKEVKEKEIKRVADDYWFNKGGQFIPQFKKVYDAMYAYRVEIDD